MAEHRLSPGDAGGTLEIEAGDRLVLALPENPGTGYTWEVESLPSGARVIEEHYEQPPGAGIGATSEHVFVVEASGGGTLRLRHGQPWLGEGGAVERYELTVVGPG